MLTAAQVKKLPVGTRIVLVENDTGKRGTLTIVKSGRKKMLRNLDVLIDIKDTDDLDGDYVTLYRADDFFKWREKE